MQYLRIVISHGGPWVSVRSSLPHVPQRHAGVQGGGFQQSIRVLAGSRVVRSELPQAFLDLAVGIPLGGTRVSYVISSPALGSAEPLSTAPARGHPAGEEG